MLENQSTVMSTVVETFLVEEVTDLIHDVEQLERWGNLVDELGLTGQTKIAVKGKSPLPFLHMKKSLQNVFECLCPRKVPVETFSTTPIPVQILDLIALSKREGYFDNIEIWYDDKDPDPACVGMKFHKFYSQTNEGNLKNTFNTKAEAKEDMVTNGWLEREPYGTDREHYLMGKWGDVKHSLDELKQLATQRYMAEEGNDLRKRLKEAERGLADLEQTAFERFNFYGESGRDTLPF